MQRHLKTCWFYRSYIVVKILFNYLTDCSRILLITSLSILCLTKVPKLRQKSGDTNVFIKNIKASQLIISAQLKPCNLSEQKLSAISNKTLHCLTLRAVVCTYWLMWNDVYVFICSEMPHWQAARSEQLKE